MDKSMNRKWFKVLAVALALMLISVIMMTAVSTDFGNVRVSNVYFPDQQGNRLHAVLYKPNSANYDTPAPAVLTVHGGNTYLDHMSNISLELARRGYVVLNLNCNGCGLSEYSASPSAQVIGNYSGLDNDGGVTQALEFLLGFDFVDRAKVSLAGHSMGGTFITNAALAHAKDINSIMVIGSGSFLKKLPTMDPQQLTFNVGYINGRYDEFVVAATQVKDTQDLLSSDFVLKGFNITDASSLVPGQAYGSFENGTARVMYTPYCSHNGNLTSNETITNILEFFSNSMGQANNLAYTNHTFMIKEIFSFIGLIGFGLFLISLTILLAYTSFFAETCNEKATPMVKMSVLHRTLAVLVCAAIPALILYKVGLWIPTLGGAGASELLPAVWANTYSGWACIVGLVTLAVFLVWHFVYGKNNGGGVAAYGLSTSTEKVEWSLRKVIKSFLLAAIIFGIGSSIIYLIYAFCPVEFRIWLFGVKALSALRWRYIPIYFLIFLVFTVVSTAANIVFSYTCEGNDKMAAVKQYGFSLLGSIGGTFVLANIYYWGLRITKYPPLFVNKHPNSIVLNDATFFMVPTFLLVSLVNTAIYRKTKNTYLSMFLSALLLAALTIAGHGFTY